MNYIRVVTIGPSGVGKTTITKRMCGHPDVRKDAPHQATVGIDFMTTRVGNENIRIYDTAGQERYQALSQEYLRNSAAMFLVFDVHDPKTLVRLCDTFRDYQERMLIDDDVVKVLIGNKSDLIFKGERFTFEQSKQMMNDQVADMEIGVMAKRMGCTAAYLTSALEDDQNKLLQILEDTISRVPQRKRIELPKKLVENQGKFVTKSIPLPRGKQESGCRC